MSVRRYVLAWCVGAALASPLLAQPFRLPGDRVALLIGTDDYAAREWRGLSSPVLDASAIAATLAGDFAFDTTVVRNGSKESIVKAIVDQGQRAKSPDDWSLIFLAAHGYFDDARGQGYLVFRDSKARADDPARSSYLSLNELRGIVEGFPAGHLVLVIDACYAGTIDPDVRAGTDRGAVENSLLRRSQYRSRLVLTSGGKEYVPDGQPGAHSPFAAGLLSALRAASADGVALTFEQIVAHMAEVAIEPLPRHNVLRGHQPGGSFIFVPTSFVAGRAVAERPPAPAVSRGAMRETAYGDVAGATVFLVQTPTAPGDARLDPQLGEAVSASLVTALQQGGLARVHVLRPGATPPACGGEAGGPCVDVLAQVAPSTVAGRQIVDITVSGTDRATGRVLASVSGRGGPYAMDVPISMIAKKAVQPIGDAFVKSVTGRGQQEGR